LRSRRHLSTWPSNARHALDRLGHRFAGEAEVAEPLHVFVSTAALQLDKSEAFGIIEPFHDTRVHLVYLSEGARLELPVIVTVTGQLLDLENCLERAPIRRRRSGPGVRPMIDRLNMGDDRGFCKAGSVGGTVVAEQSAFTKKKAAPQKVRSLTR
jgi:hypothetical protein